LSVDEETKPARLIIADDHALLRSGIRSMLYEEPDLEVVGEAADGAEALELCRRLQPDLVLMDVRMPKMDGLAATRAIKEEFPRTSVVMVTMQEDPDYLFEAVIAGAAGYVLKGATPEQLTDAVRQVLDGEFLFNHPAPPRPGPDQPPDRPRARSEPRHGQEPRAPHHRQTRSIRPHPGRRQSHGTRPARTRPLGPLVGSASYSKGASRKLVALAVAPPTLIYQLLSGAVALHQA
jgi:DNA-binding NarL/FixJ family response regulator